MPRKVTYKKKRVRAAKDHSQNLAQLWQRGAGATQNPVQDDGGNHRGTSSEDTSDNRSNVRTS
jgi:hypothetical protein